MPLVDSGVEFIREVLVRGPIARSELSQTLGLSASSLTRIARPLIDKGLLVELDDARDGSMGRPTRPLVVAPGAGRVVGVKLTGDRAHLCLADMGANEIARADEVLVSAEPVAVVEQLDALIRSLVEGEMGAPLRGVGVCLGGKVSDDGVVLRAPFLGWRNVPLARLLRDAVGVPIVLENDVVALTEAEYLVGSARGVSNFALITIGVGVGYGVVTHDRVIRSPDTGLGLAGHIPLDPSGPICPDGHRGCARAMLSMESMCIQASVALGRPVEYDELLTLSVTGDAAAAAIVEAAAASLGRLIAISANMSMHNTVVLSGDGVGLWDVAEATIRSAAMELRDPEARPLTIIVDSTGFESWARGAAAIAIERSLIRSAY